MTRLDIAVAVRDLTDRTGLPAATAEVAEELGTMESDVMKTLQRLQKDGKLRAVPCEGALPHTSRQGYELTNSGRTWLAFVLARDEEAARR